MDDFLDMGLGNYAILDDFTNVNSVDHIFGGLWKLYFGGSCSTSGSSIRMVIEGLDSKICRRAYKLKFECTNNKVDYEARIQGLELEKHVGIKYLSILGYSKLKVNHIKNKYGIKKCRLKAYAKKVWDLIDTFKEFNITFIHRERNHRADSLVVFSYLFVPNNPSDERFPS